MLLLETACFCQCYNKSLQRIIFLFREQQKSDVKDMKVLSILQQKDNQIKILQEVEFCQILSPG